MANDDYTLDELRAIAKNRQAAVGKKISRIARGVSQPVVVHRGRKRTRESMPEQGVRIAGTQHDPRRDINVVIKKYNKAQLKNYIATLNEFQSRNVNFVRGAEGTVISAAKWREYVRLENRYNELGERHLNKIADKRLPSGLTIGDRERDVKPDGFVRLGVEPTQKPFNPTKRDVRNIRGEKAMDALIKQMSKRVKNDYLPKRIKEQRKELNAALKVIGDKDLTKMAKTLSDDQFNVLWNYTPFATQIGAVYSVQQSRASNASEQRWHASVYEDYINDAYEVLEWAGARGRTEFTDTRARAMAVQFNPNDTRARPIPVQRPGKGQQGRAQGRRR